VGISEWSGCTSCGVGPTVALIGDCDGVPHAATLAAAVMNNSELRKFKIGSWRTGRLSILH
jgi:hypothetical protein